MNKYKIAQEEKIKDNSRELEEKIYVESRIKQYKAFNDKFAEYLKKYGIPTTKN